MPSIHFIKNIRSLTALLALSLPACIFPKVVGDSPLEGSTGSTGSNDTEPVVTGGPAPGCNDPALTCSAPIDCVQLRCGALDSPFDAAGCPRKSCDDVPCGADELCYAVSDQNDCPAEVSLCADVEGACTCQFGDCFTNFCIPTDEGPPIECAKITDEAACLAAGCSEFTTIVTATIVADACVFGEPTPLCMWFPADAWGGTATPGAFFKLGTDEATSFSMDWIDPPWGWAKCGAPGSPASCSCFGICPDLQSQAEQFLANDKPCADLSDCVSAEALCFDGNVCGTVGLHKDSQTDWTQMEADMASFGCCEGADPCGGTLACQDQRCVVTFP